MRLFAIHRNKAHRRARRCFANCLGIGRIILLSLHEEFDIGWRNEPNFVSKLSNLATPEMRATTSLHSNDAGWQTGKKLKDLSPS